jgi:hypothetical protein
MGADDDPDFMGYNSASLYKELQMVLHVSEHSDTPIFRFQVSLDHLNDGGRCRKLLRKGR